MKRLIHLMFLLGVTSTPALASQVLHEPTMISVGEPVADRDLKPDNVLVAQADAPAAVQVEPFAPPPTETALASDATAAPQPSDALHDPLASPAAAFDDLRAAKRIGWGVAFLVGVIMLCGILGKLGGIFAPLGTPRVLFAIGSVSTFAATAYNAVYLGGAWVAALAAAGPPLIAARVKVWQWEPQPKQGAA